MLVVSKQSAKELGSFKWKCKGTLVFSKQTAKEHVNCKGTLVVCFEITNLWLVVCFEIAKQTTKGP